MASDRPPTTVRRAPLRVLLARLVLLLEGCWLAGRGGLVAAACGVGAGGARLVWRFTTFRKGPAALPPPAALLLLLLVALGGRVAAAPASAHALATSSSGCCSSKHKNILPDTKVATRGQLGSASLAPPPAIDTLPPWLLPYFSLANRSSCSVSPPEPLSRRRSSFLSLRMAKRKFEKARKSCTSADRSECM